MDTLNQMRVFARVVESGTFTAAAISLNTSPGAVSRAISELETRIRTRLLNRSTRKVALTQAGEVYLKRCNQILADIEMAEEEASDAQSRPVGKLRVHSFAGIGQYYVLPAINEYRVRFPEVSVELTLSQRVPELYEGSTDMAVVATSSVLPDSDLVSHLLGSSCSILCASPEYVQRRGAPQTPAQLAGHDCLILHSPAFPAYEWLLESDKGSESMRVSGPIEINDPAAIGMAARASMGIGVLPIYTALEGLADGSLVRVLPAYTLQKMNLYSLHPSRRYTDARIKTWVEFLRQYLPAATARDAQLLQAH
jgi:DNA-binding transcriptional LysR family regulator